MSEGGGWFARLRTGLAKSSTQLTRGISAILARGGLDPAAIEELEELLIQADLGAGAAEKLCAHLAKRRFDGGPSEDAVRAALTKDITDILSPLARPLAIDPAHRPHVVLVAGVNGTGKTTTIGKLAHFYHQQGLKVVLAAADTFRAAAIDQLQRWGERVDVPVVATAAGADPAALAFDALIEARQRDADLLLIDTAGRLHNKADLMAELQKIIRVLRKLDARAPHDCVLVLDATTGQNAHAQVETFKQLTDVSGLIVTKLDGTARGGVIVALAERFALPLHAIGVGEGADDLRPFDANDFARSLLGLSS